MSASKAREVLAVEPYFRESDGAPRCKVTVVTPTGGSEFVALHTLSRGELLRAAKRAYPDIAGNAWFKVPGDEIQELLRGAFRPEVAKLTVKRNGEQPTIPDNPADGPITVDDDEPPKPAAKRPATPNGDDDAAQLAALLARLAGGSTIDEATVERIVVAKLDAAISDLPVKRITVDFREAPSVDLPEQHHDVLPKVLQCVGAGEYVFLVGPAGTGKSTIAHQCSEALSLPFYALSLGPTTPTSKLFGYLDANGNYVRTPFREAYEGGGIMLLDELDNGHPGLVAEINQATANGYCAFADDMVKRHDDFRLIATGNTYGTGPDRMFVGRNILDAATLDRFATIDVPVDETLERTLALAFADETCKGDVTRWISQVQNVRAKAQSQKLPVVVSPRASIQGARLLRAGLPLADVAEMRLWKGMSSDTRSKLS